MSTFATAVFTIIMAGLAVFQAALALGAPYGHFAWGGQHQHLPVPLRIGSVVSIAIYAILASLILQGAGLIAVWPDTWLMPGIWIVVGYCALGIPVNAISRSRPERMVMTPLVAILFICALTVALGL